MRVGATIDATGRADLELAVAALHEVGRRYSARGIEVHRPVDLIVENLPIMGATESRPSGHRLHVGLQAVRSGMLDGLLAHEVGHMVRTEQGHPSHSRTLHRRVLDSLPVPPAERRAFSAVAGAAINHVEDVYADDLAVDVIGRDRIGPFFSDWAARSASAGRTRWETVANEVTVAFALGNLERHGVPPGDGVDRRVAAFRSSASLPRLPAIASRFSRLPKTSEARPVEDAVRGLLSDALQEGVAPG